jgi:signal transduction histidine kinase/CheY-like chemotaxis protein
VTATTMNVYLLVVLLLLVATEIWTWHTTEKRHDPYLSPLNNLLKYTDIRTIKSMMDFGIWEYDPTLEEFTLSPMCSDILGLDKPRQQLSLEKLAPLIHHLDRDDFISRMRTPWQTEHVFYEMRSQHSDIYYKWLRMDGKVSHHPLTNEPLIAGRLVDATNNVLIKRIQTEMRELLNDVIEHLEVSLTLRHICRIVSEIEPAIKCVVFINRDHNHKKDIIHSTDLSYELSSILKSVTLSDEQSELKLTYQKRRALYIPDLSQLDAWRSITDINISEQPRTFIGQTLITNDNKIHGAICLYLPNNDFPENVLEVFLGTIHKTASVAIEDQLQSDNRDRIQQQLYHSQKMDTIGHLTGGIAHDFNNILGSIVGYNSLAKKVANKLQHDKLRAYVNEVGIAADRARDLINQMMMYSRAEPIEKTQVDVQLVIKEVLQLVRSMIPTSIDIKASYSKLPSPIRVNPISLHQVILNHLINAKDAMKNEVGTIRVNTFPAYKVSKVCRSCHERFEGNYVAVEISDDGVGIASEMLDKIFDPFFTTKEIGRGTGMGLSVVHGILHDINAHVTVQSTVGRGSTFTLYFPEAESEINKPGDNDPLVATRDTNTGSGQHIIVVDDDIPLSLLMQEILQSNGYRVSRFDNGKEALEQFIQAPEDYDLVLTDQTMPVMTGDVMAEAMLKYRPDIPIIVCTGYSERLTLERAEEVGLTNIFKKPVDLYQLLEKISQELETKESIS